MALSYVPRERVLWIAVEGPAELVNRLRRGEVVARELARHSAVAVEIDIYGGTWVFGAGEFLRLVLALERHGDWDSPIGREHALRDLLDALLREGPARMVDHDDRPEGPAVVGQRRGVWVVLSPGLEPPFGSRLGRPSRWHRRYGLERPGYDGSQSEARPPGAPSSGPVWSPPPREEDRSPSPAPRVHPPAAEREPGDWADERPALERRMPPRPQRAGRLARAAESVLNRFALRRRESSPPVRSRPKAEPPTAASIEPPDIPPDTGVDAPGPWPSAETLSRTPHLRLKTLEKLGRGDVFEFDVWCDDDAPAAGEAVTPVSVVGPPEQRAFELNVWLAASAHFELDRLIDVLVIERDIPRSMTVTFSARVVDEPPPGPGTISALFSYAGRSCGQVTRVLPMGALKVQAVGDPDPPGEPSPLTASDPPPGGPPGAPPKIVIRTDQIAPDVTVEVRSLDADGHSFACRVLTAGSDDVEPVTWNLAESLASTVASYMQDFTEPGLSDDERRSKLEGAGMALWDVAPAAFTSRYWALASSIESILIVTDDWSFPWELLVPTRGRGRHRETHRALGIAYNMGRWVTDDMIAPQQVIPLVDSYAFAPEYLPPLELVNAQAEAQYVCTNFAGALITPGDFEALESFFGRSGVSLVHFVCHGEAPVGRSQAIALADNGTLLAHQLAAMSALSQAVAQTEPLVFLNACEVGRGAPAMIGPGGFATAFIGIGARGVIAPLWSVEDSVAHDVAITFYDAVRSEPDVPLSAIMRALRARAYSAGGADTWGAYCLYGDPLARTTLIG